jgi:hypothetical protein
MIVVSVLDQRGELGLLPRLGGSTLAGVIILTVFVGGSIWLAHREPGLSRWPRRTVLAGSALVAVIGLAGFASADTAQRLPWRGEVEYVYGDLYEHVRDVFVIDSEGRLLTGVTLRDQDGNLIDLGWSGECEQRYDASDRPIITYPRCPDQAPWWVPPMDGPPTPSPTPTLTLVPTLSPQPSPTPSSGPSPSTGLSPGPSPSAGPDASPTPAPAR